MPKFRITVGETMTTEVEVEAPTQKEAEKEALSQAETGISVDWNYGCDFHVTHRSRRQGI